MLVCFIACTMKLVAAATVIDVVDVAALVEAVIALAVIDVVVVADVCRCCC